MGMAAEGQCKIRRPVVAGMFYPAEVDHCRLFARQCLESSSAPATLSGDVLGGLVPHAGWICSGALAGETICALARQPWPDVVVIFGAVHSYWPEQRGGLDSFDRWRLPGMDMAMAVELRAMMAGEKKNFIVDDRPHIREHSIEVVLPLIAQSLGQVPVLAVEVGLVPQAVEIGIRAAELIGQSGLKAFYLASSDLTHYGTNYGFTPAGVGPKAMDWEIENDRPLLDLMVRMDAEKVVPEVMANQNACGGGAIAAMLAACRVEGARKGVVLRHANSFQTLAQVSPQKPDNAVGYASVVITSDVTSRSV